MNPSYRRDKEHNYMLLESPLKIQGNEYQVRMLLINEIPGILKCKMRCLDGISTFYYEITSRQPLSRVFETRLIRAEDIYALLMGMNKALCQASRYLLDENCFLLEPEFIYMDVETKEISLCYLPFHEGDIGEAFRKLAEYILKNLDHNQEKAVLWGYQIYSRTTTENYSVNAVLQSVYQKIEKEEQVSDVTDRDKDLELSGKEDGNTDEKKHLPEEELHRKEENQGFRKRRPVGQEAPRKRAGKEKMDERQKPAEWEADKQKADKQKAEKRRIGSARLEKEQKAASRRKKAWIIAAGGIAFLGIAAAGILEILSLTQAGGLIFLLGGIIVYLFSMKTENAEHAKKTPDRKINAEQENKTPNRKMIKKEGEEKEKRQKRDKDGTSDMEEGVCNFYEEEALEWGDADLITAEPDLILELAGKEDEKEQEVLADEQEMEFGQTTLLRGGTPGEYPVLISINPDVRDNVVIEGERLIVGKLKGQVDLVLNLSVVSRIHACIQRQPEGIFLKDLNSTNGTFLNGERLEANESRKLHTGDEIFFAGAGYYFKE